MGRFSLWDKNFATFWNGLKVLLLPSLHARFLGGLQGCNKVARGYARVREGL